MDWKKLFDSMGLNGTRWQWRIMKWQQGWADFKERLGSKKKQVKYQHKFCNECNALIDRDDKICPHCEAKVSSYRAQVASRTVRSVAPAWFLTVTHLLLAANLIVGLFTLIPAEEGSVRMVLSNLLTSHGMFQRDYVSLEGHWWRLISYGYLHGNFLHILFNMIALIQLGPLVENAIGRRRFFVLYSVGLIVAVVPKLFLGSSVGTVGASGAIFGLIGFGITFSHTQGMKQWRNIFLNWAGMALVFGFVVPNVDNLAHGGGLIAGLILGLLLGKEGLARAENLRRTLNPIWLATAYILFACTLWSFYLWLHEAYLSMRLIDLMQ
jgi:rhomboid protease GluP